MRAAGVSIQTVSNVINGRDGVAATTEHRVREAARALGYRRSEAARTLRTGRTHSIGFLARDIANPFYASMARGVEDAARPHGYSVVIGSTSNSIEQIKYLLGVFRELRVAGVVASTNPLMPEYTQLVEDFSMSAPFVQLGPAASTAHISRVMVDDERGGYVATGHLLSLGRTRVAIIVGPLDRYGGTLRLAGYRRALADWGARFDPMMVIEGSFDFQSGSRAVDQLLEIAPRPDAIFAANDLTANGAISRLRQRGVRVPDDMAIIGYDDVEVARMYDPPISTIAQPPFELGRRGVHMLMERLVQASTTQEGDQPDPRREILDCTLIVRQSTSGRIEDIQCGPISAQAPWRAYVIALPGPHDTCRESGYVEQAQNSIG